jgi:hypothetical protein
MARNTTTENSQDRSAAQWFRAWDFLDVPQRLAIIAFCMRSDADIASVALKI